MNAPKKLFQHTCQNKAKTAKKDQNKPRQLHITTRGKFIHLFVSNTKKENFIVLIHDHLIQIKNQMVWKHATLPTF